MAFTKVLASNEFGSVSVSESGGVASLTANASAKLGGGEAADVVSFTTSNGIQISAKQLIDLGLELAASKYPSVAPEIALVQAGIDAELAKV